MQALITPLTHSTPHFHFGRYAYLLPEMAFSFFPKSKFSRKGRHLALSLSPPVHTICKRLEGELENATNFHSQPCLCLVHYLPVCLFFSTCLCETKKLGFITTVISQSMCKYLLECGQLRCNYCGVVPPKPKRLSISPLFYRLTLILKMNLL